MLQSNLKQSKYYAQDTKELQMYSLMQFMSALKYNLCRTVKWGLVFVSSSPAKVENRTVSVQTAIRLHNADWRSVYPMAPAIYDTDVQTFHTDTYTITQAKAAKVVEKVKLQYCKRSKSLKLQHESGHMVRFVSPSYQYLFLMEEL